MSGSRVLLPSITFALLLLCSSMTAAYKFDDYTSPLHRIVRTPQLNTALLVPFPRVGKRASEAAEFNPSSSDISAEKRLYFARVGKRYMYAARVGRK